MMNLIDRYLFQIGRHLPKDERQDILAEIRSSINDALEDRYGQSPGESDINQVLREFGPPEEIAASYHPAGSYLIGPSLYPLFKMVTGIAIAAVVGAQALAWAVTLFLGNDPFEPLNALAGLINSIPATVGMVVIVFAVLQRFGVQPEMNRDEAWDPAQLPSFEPSSEVKRTEKIFEIGFTVLILVLLFGFSEHIGFWTIPGGQFLPNPVIGQYLGWISLSLLAGLALDIYLLWQGHWSRTTKFLNIASNLLSIGILALLVQGHSAWLASQNAGGFIQAIESLESNLATGSQLVGMHAFRLGFLVALIVISIETIVQGFRALRSGQMGEYPVDSSAA